MTNKPLDLKDFQSLTLSASVELSAAVEAVEGEKPKNRRFTIEAYDGGSFRQGWAYYPLVVDLAGMQQSRPTLPVLIAHDSSLDSILGQADSVEIKKTKLTVSGEILGVSEEAQKAVALADRGFKFQASIGATPLDAQFIAEGETVKANGKTHKGPCYYVTKSDLYEVSFVAIGAAKNTSATIAASLGRESEMTTPESTPALAGPATIHELKAAFPKADPAFQMNCLERNLTLTAAQGAYAMELQAKLDATVTERDELKAANATLTQELVAEKAKNVAPPAKPKPGFTPHAEKNVTASESGSDPIAAFNEAVGEKVRAGMSKSKAVGAIVAENPQLHAEFVAASQLLRR